MRYIIYILVFLFVAGACDEDPVLRKSKRSGSDQNISPSDYVEGGVNCNWTTDVPLFNDGGQIGIRYLSVIESKFQFGKDFAGSEWIVVSDSAWIGECGRELRSSDVKETQQFTPDDNVQWNSFAVPTPVLPECGCIVQKTQVQRYDSHSTAAKRITLITEIPYCQCESD